MSRMTISVGVSCLLVVLFTGVNAQDRSAMWSIGARLAHGLDTPSPQQAAGSPAGVPNSPSAANATDVRVFVSPNGYAQSENSIAVNISNPNELMISTNGRIPLTPTVVHQTWFFSTDAGSTWSGSEDNPPSIAADLGDPVAVFDLSGRAYYVCLGAVPSTTTGDGILVTSTTDGGATWAPSTNADPTHGASADKEHACTDLSGTYPDNLYIAWTDFGVTGSPVVFNRSTNKGATWGSRQVLQIGSNRGQGVHLASGPNGEVYVMWAHYTTGTAEVGIGFAKSTNGGVSFSTPVVAFPISGVRISNTSIAALNNTRASSFPYFDVDRSSGPRRGWIYAVTSELSNSQSDIFVRSSSDAGTSWSAPTRMNEPDVQTGKWQWMASVAVDQSNGDLTVSYYSMDSVGTNFMTNRYAAYSRDGGQTWENTVISDARFNWQPQGTPNTNAAYAGDYYETAAFGSKAWACWSDRRPGYMAAWVEQIVYADPVDPNPPQTPVAFSDFSTPTSMLLRWTRPTTLVNGTPIGPFVTRISRDGTPVADVADTDSTYTDTGLTDGTSYVYALRTRLLANDSLSAEVLTSWIAGGSPVPSAASGLTVSGTAAAGYKIRWVNPASQVDGTRLDDFAGIRLFRDGTLLSTLARTAADTGRVDSVHDSPPAGFHAYHVVVIDDELPVNGSSPSNTGFTPLEIPFTDAFTTAGAPNTGIWTSTGVDVNDLGLNEPSAPYSLNLNGSPTSNSDNIETLPLDLAGLADSLVTLAYFYQPRGTGDNPEAADSLIVEFRNSLGQWITVRKYPGLTSTVPTPPYTFDAIRVAQVDPQGGTFHYNGFKFRFRSRGTAGTLDDDWFVDDVFFGIPTGTPNLGVTSVLAPTGEVAVGGPVHPLVAVTNTSPVNAGSFDVRVEITGPGTSYTATQTDMDVPAGATNVVTVASAFTPDAAGTWSMTAFTLLSGDPNALNDTLRTNFNVVPPLPLPLMHTFADSGAPDPLVWQNINGAVTADGDNEPSAPFALNLGGNPTGIGLDTVTTRVIDLAGMEGLGVAIAYFQQPQGTGDVPETADSLVAEALNSRGDWLAVQKLPGAPNRPFTLERFSVDSLDAGEGSYFHSGFRFRFRSRATTATSTRQDDWFVDDVFIGIPSGAPVQVLSGSSIADTVLVGTVDSTSYAFSIRNDNPFGSPLNFAVTEDTAASWLVAAPPSGSIAGGSEAAVSVRVNFGGATSGTFRTHLIVAGNDPSNAADTVEVQFVVNNAPVITIAPDSFAYALGQGGIAIDSFTVGNAGLGPLMYDVTVDGAIAGAARTEMISPGGSSFTGSPRVRGNGFQVSEDVSLIGIEYGLTVPQDNTDVEFFVYQSPTSGGEYTKLFGQQKVVNTTSGFQMIVSDPLRVDLHAGVYYYIGLAWQGSASTEYRYSTVTLPPTWGTVLGRFIGPNTAFPAPATLTISSYTAGPYYSALSTGIPFNLTMLSPVAGTVAPGSSVNLAFRAAADSIAPGDYLSHILVGSNDPVRPLRSIAVQVNRLATGVNDHDGTLPVAFALEQNFPNPFNPTTQIRFALPVESIVTLTIYNLLGQTVATLTQERQGPGYFRADWNGRSGDGALAGTGVYFYRLEARAVDGSMTYGEVKKMVLLK